MYQKNREELANRLKDHVLVIAAQSALQFSADIPYPFRQDSNFWYLTGINEPDLILVIDTSRGESTLLLPTQNDYQLQWDGENNTTELTQISGIKKFGAVSDLEKHLKKAQKRGLRVGYLAPLPETVQPYGFYANPSRRRVEALIKTVIADPVDIRADIARMRQIKHPEEIALIQSAIDVTTQALASVKTKLATYTNEKDIERALTVEFYSRGSDGHGFEPIIASGKNAATIHYKKNDDKVYPDSLLLMDIGAKSGGYSADISRVWAVGKISSRMREVYDTLLDIQTHALHTVKPGITLHEFQKSVETYAFKKQAAIGIDHDSYPHGISHFLGFDVHDAGDYEMPLADGMVLTVEPGIYLPDEGIGVRIEDDVLITKSGIKVLSDAIPKIL